MLKLSSFPSDVNCSAAANLITLTWTQSKSYWHFRKYRVASRLSQIHTNCHKWWIRPPGDMCWYFRDWCSRCLIFFGRGRVDSDIPTRWKILLAIKWLWKFNRIYIAAWKDFLGNEQQGNLDRGKVFLKSLEESAREQLEANIFHPVKVASLVRVISCNLSYGIHWTSEKGLISGLSI